MSDRKPQIAYAPVNCTGQVLFVCLSASRVGAEDNLRTVTDILRRFDFDDSAWRIRRVRIEIDE